MQQETISWNEEERAKLERRMRVAMFEPNLEGVRNMAEKGKIQRETDFHVNQLLEAFATVEIIIGKGLITKKEQKSLLYVAAHCIRLATHNLGD